MSVAKQISCAAQNVVHGKPEELEAELRVLADDVKEPLDGQQADSALARAQRTLQHAVSRLGRIDVGDKIGMLLNFTAGSLTFYLNGQVYGPGFPSGVTGDLVRAVEMYNAGTVVTLNTAAPIPA